MKFAMPRIPKMQKVMIPQESVEIFLIEKIFVPNEVNMVYSMYDRIGGRWRASCW